MEFSISLEGVFRFLYHQGKVVRGLWLTFNEFLNFCNIYLLKCHLKYNNTRIYLCTPLGDFREQMDFFFDKFDSKDLEITPGGSLHNDLSMFQPYKPFLGPGCVPEGSLKLVIKIFYGQKYSFLVLQYLKKELLRYFYPQGKVQKLYYLSILQSMCKVNNFLKTYTACHKKAMYKILKNIFQCTKVLCNFHVFGLLFK